MNKDKELLAAINTPVTHEGGNIRDAEGRKIISLKMWEDGIDSIVVGELLATAINNLRGSKRDMWDFEGEVIGEIFIDPETKMPTITPSNNLQEKEGRQYDLEQLRGAWPLTEVLKVLARATEILLHKKDYDGPDYEEMNICVARAKESIAANELYRSPATLQPREGEESAGAVLRKHIRFGHNVQPNYRKEDIIGAMEEYAYLYAASVQPKIGVFTVHKSMDKDEDVLALITESAIINVVLHDDGTVCYSRIGRGEDVKDVFQCFNPDGVQPKEQASEQWNKQIEGMATLALAYQKALDEGRITPEGWQPKGVLDANTEISESRSEQEEVSEWLDREIQMAKDWIESAKQRNDESEHYKMSVWLAALTHAKVNSPLSSSTPESVLYCCLAKDCLNKAVCKGYCAAHCDCIA